MKNEKNISDGKGFFRSDGFCYARPTACNGDYATVDGREYEVQENHIGTAYIEHGSQSYILLH